MPNRKTSINAMKQITIQKWLVRWLLASKAQLLDSLQAFLVRRGIVLFRVPANAVMPPSLIQYLQSLTSRDLPVNAVVGFDDDPYIQKDFLSVFASNRVSFFSRPSPGKGALGFPAADSLEPPVKPFLVEIDGETFRLTELCAEFPWLMDAEIVLIRSTLGFFWSGKGDLRLLIEFMAKRGLIFYDVLEYFKLHLLNAPMGRVVLVFEKRKPKRNCDAIKPTQASVRDEVRFARINEAMTFLSKPIALSSELVRLTGRGSLGFAAGVLNPGAIASKEGVVLLARGEHIPWALTKHSLGDFLHGCQPVRLELNDQLAVIRTGQLALSNAKAIEGTRLEDFRLFRFGGQLFSNHVLAVPTGEPPSEQNPIRSETIRFRIGFSLINEDKNELIFLGSPTLDMPLKFAEKNWACFEHQKELFLIYSFNPYHLLRARHWPQLDFSTVIRHEVAFPDEGDKITFRNSVNPVEYDQHYFLHVIHKVYSGKQYAYWAVLIDKESLLPKKISACPLICGWKSASAAITYVCSVVPRHDEILIFGGLNDSAMGFWRVSRFLLDANWTTLHSKDEANEAKVG